MKQLKIRIYPDGSVQAKTEGIRGKACTEYIAMLEQMLEARAVDSEYTAEYYQTNVHETSEVVVNQT